MLCGCPAFVSCFAQGILFDCVLSSAYFSIWGLVNHASGHRGSFTQLLREKNAFQSICTHMANHVFTLQCSGWVTTEVISGQACVRPMFAQASCLVLWPSGRPFEITDVAMMHHLLSDLLVYMWLRSRNSFTSIASFTGGSKEYHKAQSECTKLDSLLLHKRSHNLRKCSLKRWQLHAWPPLSHAVCIL